MRRCVAVAFTTRRYLHNGTHWPYQLCAEQQSCRPKVLAGTRILTLNRILMNVVRSCVRAKVTASEIQSSGGGGDDSATRARVALTSSACQCLRGPPTYCRRATLESMLTVGDRPIAMTIHERQILTRRQSLPSSPLPGGSDGPRRRTRRSSISGGIWESNGRGDTRLDHSDI